MKERTDEQNIESNGGADRRLLIDIKSTYRDVGAFCCGRLKYKEKTIDFYE